MMVLILIPFPLLTNLMMDLRRAQETAAAARRQEETNKHQEEWMWSEE